MISFDEFLKQDEADKYNMLQECIAIIQQKENIIKEVREYCKNDDNFQIQDLYSQDIVDRIQEELLEMLGGRNNE